MFSVFHNEIYRSSTYESVDHFMGQGVRGSFPKTCRKNLGDSGKSKGREFTASNLMDTE